MIIVTDQPKIEPNAAGRKQLLNVASTPNKRVVLGNSGTEATLDSTSYCLLMIEL